MRVLDEHCSRPGKTLQAKHDSFPCWGGLPRALSGLVYLAVSLTSIAAATNTHVPAPSGQTPKQWELIEVLTEAPTQAPALLTGIGDISFPITTKNAQAQRFFNQGIALLHGFWHAEAERAFRQVAVLDPGCGMAEWGMAMANCRDARRATGFVKQALLKKANLSSREQRWIEAYANLYVGTSKADPERRRIVVEELEKLCLDFPEDMEARAFLLWQLWDNFDRGMPRPSPLLVNDIANTILARQPMHHGVHQVLIHLWGGVNEDQRARQSAAIAGQAAPSIAHQWYSAGLVLGKLGQYSDAIWCHQAAARVAHAHMAADHSLPDDDHLYAENNRLIISSLASAGRVREAIENAKGLIELPRGGPNREEASRVGRSQLLEILSGHEMWADLLALDGTVYLPTLTDSREEAARLRMLGIAAFRSGQAERGKTLLRQLQIVRMKVRGQRLEAAEKAEQEAKKRELPEDQVALAIAETFRAYFAELNSLESGISEVILSQALMQGDREEAELRLKALKDLPKVREAQARFALNQRPMALDLVTKASAGSPLEPLSLAIQADLEWRAGEKDAALKTFQKLRPLSGALDLTIPVFARLSPIAQALNLASDWRIGSGSEKTAPKAAKHLDLDKLGPAQWHPYSAPAWQLTDGDGKTRSISEFRGRPVLILFYLGSGCVHCIEQLNSFAPLAKQFADIGST